jgi:hypothetical protein
VLIGHHRVDRPIGQSAATAATMAAIPTTTWWRGCLHFANWAFVVGNNSAT